MTRVVGNVAGPLGKRWANLCTFKFIRSTVQWQLSANGGSTSNGEYGVPQGLQFGFPVRADGSGAWEVVEDLAHDEFAKERIRITTEELAAERSEVIDLLP